MPMLMTRLKLHVSLTRPFTVRAHERDEYVKVALNEIRRLPAETTR